MPIALFFIGHWTSSVFFQTFFLHRYGAHRMFTMSKGWERFFFLCTYITQGSSFLNPRGYAVLHRMHHAFSDTPRDPHSPRNHSNFFTMMWATRKTYHDLAHDLVKPEARFDGGVPEWRALDRIGQSWIARTAWIGAYTAFYFVFATAWWHWLFLPFHYVMGPVHGAIVNWCGHRSGYRNFESDDDSRNTLIFDFVTLGELFQNNHHKYGMSPRFSVRWFEVDPAWQIIRVMAFIGILDLGARPQFSRWNPGERNAEAAPESDPEPVAATLGAPAPPAAS